MSEDYFPVIVNIHITSLQELIGVVQMLNDRNVKWMATTAETGYYVVYETMAHEPEFSDVLQERFVKHCIRNAETALKHLLGLCDYDDEEEAQK